MGFNTTAYSKAGLRFGARLDSRKHRPAGAGRAYEVTNRGRELLEQQAGYPKRWLEPAQLTGLKVLDLCCGGGLFVQELRARGVDIQGVDDYLSLAQRQEPEVFIQSDIRHLPVANASVDVLYSAFGVFSFGAELEAVQKAALQEASRVLKPDGKLRLGGVQPDAIRALLRQIPSSRLEITYETPAEFCGWNEPMVVELTRR